MSDHLCISIRFADPTFRGRGDGGEPEWPPSPLRVFQALVAACAARFGNPDRFRDHAAPAFGWLSGLPAPLVIAPACTTGTPFRLAVPNNDMDAVGRCWARNAEPDPTPAQLKTLKPVRPTHFAGGEELPAVHYLWPLTDADRPTLEQHKEMLFAAARSIVALGWGVDMAVGHGRVLDAAGLRELEGERWNPSPHSGTRLRVPITGTLEALVTRHHEFVSRLSDDGLKPVPLLTVFTTVGYRRDTDATPRPFAAFELRTPDFERFQPYDPVRHTPAVAGMIRNAVAELAKQTRPFGWTDEDINTFVHGHTADGNDRAHGDGADRRFSFLPLPSLERRGSNAIHVGSIRRVLVTAAPEDRNTAVWARVLSGQELSPLGATRPAALRLIDRSELSLRADPNLGPYVGEARAWSTVTPVVLPGYDDTEHHRRRLRGSTDPNEQRQRLTALDERAGELLGRALCQAGFAKELIARSELQWRNAGFWPGVDLARRYTRSDHHRRFSVYHVRVVFPSTVCGPLAVGAGRYRGLGVFAAETG